MHAYDLDRLAGPALHVRRAPRGRAAGDARRRASACSTTTRCWSATPRPASASAASWAARRARCREATTRVAMEARDLERAATSSRPRRSWACAPRRARASRSSSTPSLRFARQRLAARLMVELCGARMAPGHDRRRGGAFRRRRRLTASPRAPRAAAGRAHRGRARRARSWSGSGSASSARDGELDGRGAVLPPLRRHARGRPDRGGRAHPRPRQAALDAARARAGGRRPDARAEAAARWLEDLLRGRGLSEVVTYSFISPHAIERLRLPAGDEQRRVLHIANPLSEEQSAMRTTLLPGLLDAARYNLDRDIRRPAPVRDRPRLLLQRTGPAAGRAAPPGRAARRRLRARDLALAERAGGLLRDQGAAGRACSRRWASTGGWPTAGPPSCIPAVRPRCWSAATRRAGWASCTRSSRARSGLDEPPAVMELDLERGAGGGRRLGAVRGPDQRIPPSSRTSPSSWTRRSRRRPSSTRCAQRLVRSCAT